MDKAKIPDKVIYVCTGDKCKKRGGKELAKFIRGVLKDNGLKGKVEVIKTHCTDNCKLGPVVCCQPGNKWLFHAKESDIEEILDNVVKIK